MSIPPPPEWMNQRTLSPAAYRRAAKQLGLTISALGRFLGTTERNSHRIARGQADPTTSTCLLIASMLYHGERPPLLPRKRTSGGKLKQY